MAMRARSLRVYESRIAQLPLAPFSLLSPRARHSATCRARSPRLATSHSSDSTCIDREIVVVDVRSELLSMHHYRPGYAPQQQIPMRRALELRSQVAPRVLWLLMSPSHWSALLPH